MSRPKKIRRVQEEQQFVDDVEQKRDFINSLDHYSLEKIFMLLPIYDRMNMQKVCTRWKEVCKLAWYDIKKYKCSHTIGRAYNDQLLTQSYVENLILNCGTYLQDLTLSKICTSSIMPIIGEHCNNLTRFEFVFDDKLPFNTFDYIQAFTKLNKMKSVKIHFVDLVLKQDTKLKSEILRSLPKGINELHVIYKKSKWFEDPWLIDLRKFEHLHSLTFSGCNLDRIIRQISEKITLVYLNLERSSLSPRLMNTGIFNKLVNLEHVHLFESIENFSPPNFATAIFNRCKNIRYFKASTLYIFDPPTSNENWKNLEYLSIVWFIDYDSALEIVKYCHNLKCLSLKMRIPNSALQKLTELKNLECLEFFFYLNYNDESVLAISNNCKKLKHLEIPYEYRSYSYDTEDDDDDDDTYTEDDTNDDYDYYDDVPVFSVTILDELSKLEYLEYLNVSGVHKFTDSSIIAVANKCKSLKCLNISSCKYITEAGLNAITSLESLQKLNVSNLKSVTNSVIIKLKGLKSLEATWCRKITDSGIIQFIKNCPDLEQLRLFATNMTVKTIIAADQKTKCRMNGIILYIHSSRRLIEKSCRPIINSKWLVIYYRK